MDILTSGKFYARKCSNKLKGLVFLCLFVTLNSCGVRNKNAILNYVKDSGNDTSQLLNVQSNGSGYPVEVRDLPPSPAKNKTCTRTQYSLAKNFLKIAILKPNKGIIWPGAIIKANQSLTDGLPEPVTLLRSPVTLSIDLPGMGGEGTRIVDNPSNSSVQAAVDDALEWWNGNAYQEGYVNPASSSYNKAVSYSSEQTGLELGLNLAWDSGEVSSALKTSTNETKKVVTAVYQQAFYTVTVDTPANPGAVFPSKTSLSDIKKQISNTEPGAYVSNVTYGRIILVRMETSSQEHNEEIEAAFEYSLGKKKNVSIEAETKYKRILNDSDTSFNLVTLGGNPDKATKPITDSTSEGVLAVIRNATYSRSNPGVPISYTVRHLADNSLVKLGASTEYTATDCVINSSKVTVNYKGIKVLGDCRLFEGRFYWDLWAQGDNGKKIELARRHKKDALVGDDVGGTYFSIKKKESFIVPQTEGSYVKLTGNVYEKLTSTKFPTFTKKLLYEDNWSAGNYKDELNPTGKVGASACNVRLDYEITVKSIQ